MHKIHVKNKSHVETTEYFDGRFEGSKDDYMDAIIKSSTLYVGNLSFFTFEEQVYELFSRAGDVRRVIMGLDRTTKTPCGFCFVEYYARDVSSQIVIESEFFYSVWCRFGVNSTGKLAGV